MSNYNVNRRRSVKARLVQIHGSRCHDCGGTHPPYMFDFDHRDPKEKSFTISSGGTIAFQKQLEESKKCDLVCANCHRERTHRQRCDGCEFCVSGWNGERYGGSTRPERKHCACGKVIARRAKTCRDCWEPITKANWPDDQTLVNMVEASSRLAVAKELGVSNVAVAKRYNKIKGV